MSINKIIMHSISIKTGLILIVCIIIIMTISGFVSYLIEKKHLIGELEVKSEQISERIAYTLTDSLFYYNDQAVKDIINFEMKNREVLCISVQNMNDDVYYGVMKDNNLNIIEYQELFNNNIPLFKKISKTLTKEYKRKKHVLGNLEIYYTDYYLYRELKNIIVKNIIQILIVSIITLIILFLSIQKIILAPITSLKEAVLKFTAGQFTVRTTMKSDDELGMIGKAFNTMAKSIEQYSENMENLVEKRTEELNIANTKLSLAMKELWGEMELAKKLQTVLLPENPVMKGFEIEAFIQPVASVGGDYYDIITVKDRHWVIIGDVSGHEVNAGLIMMMIQTAIHTVLNRHPDIAPDRLITEINITITQNIKKLGELHYMSLCVIALMPDGKFVYSGMHLPILIYQHKTKSIRSIELDGSYIGIHEDIANVNHNEQFYLDTNDVLLLYTDGIIEAMDKTGKLFSYQRLVRVFQETAELPLKEIKENILLRLNDYTIKDDITMVVIKKTG